MTALDPVAQAEGDTLAEILTWVQEVVEGRGDSISQMIVSTVLGCVPFVGQAIDVYNILRSLYGLTREIGKMEHWLDLVLSLIAFVPGFGDALKNVFRALLSGKKMGRILDAVPNSVRGNIEHWFRTLNWSAYAVQTTHSLDNILTQLIDVVEYRITRWVVGREGVQRLVRQLKNIKAQVKHKINEAMDHLRSAHQSAMHDPLPNTSAHVPASRTAPKTATPHTQAPGSVKTTTAGTATPAAGSASAKQRQSQKSKQTNARTGVSGEHIADYYYVRRKKSRRKVNHNGQLYEMTQSGHQGIDHVWHAERLPFKYRISDTKGTNNPFHKLETSKKVFEALRYGIDAYMGEGDESRTANAVGTTVGDGRQLSRFTNRTIAVQMRKDESRLTPHFAMKNIGWLPFG